MGVRVGVAPCGNELALREILAFIRTWLVILVKNILHVGFIGSKALPSTC